MLISPISSSSGSPLEDKKYNKIISVMPAVSAMYPDGGNSVVGPYDSANSASSYKFLDEIVASHGFPRKIGVPY
jgi:hypothetical protein